MKRNTPVERTWPTETAYTARIAVRLPIWVRDRLRYYVTQHNMTTTDFIVMAVKEALDKRGY